MAYYGEFLEKFSKIEKDISLNKIEIAKALIVGARPSYVTPGEHKLRTAILET